MQVLLCILLFAGAMAENPQMGDISFEWQEIIPGQELIVNINDWMERGFSFNINSKINNQSSSRLLGFTGPAPEYQYLGYLAWNSLMAEVSDCEPIELEFKSESTGESEVELFNAEQVSTYANYNASRAIDGDEKTYSYTKTFTGTHWWQVSMTDTIVSQIVLKAANYNGRYEINVSLYNGETQVGACDQHSGGGRAETLSCDEPVTANRVKLTFTCTEGNELEVYEIKVTGAAVMPMGITGDWNFLFDKDAKEITISYKKDDSTEEMLAVMQISNCSAWMKDSEYMVMTGFSDETAEMNDYYKYSTFIAGPDSCKRGEFFWQEECNKCPPGKSTVRQINNEYSDCIDTRYIKCEPIGAELECEMIMCPCNDSEECEMDKESENYGMCKQRSDYMNSARGAAGATTLVAMVAAFFTL